MTKVPLFWFILSLSLLPLLKRRNELYVRLCAGLQVYSMALRLASDPHFLLPTNSLCGVGALNVFAWKEGRWDFNVNILGEGVVCVK